ncbi:MAG TPA: hypothetical protein VMJ49_06645 [Gaiellaceae bacterium]|nr:hypothetical protein [Gaiellaceae bacterium]
MRVALLLVVVAAAAAVAAAPAGATNECRGLQVCVPISGPWVLADARSEVRYQLACPKRFVVGGLDAELSVRGIAISFLGALGAPVNPGVTTSTAAVFLGRVVRTGVAGASFRPHVGCIPASGGGQRTPTAYRAFPPSKPALPEMTEIPVRSGTHRYVRSCKAGERLVGATHAIAFYTDTPPTRALASSISATQSVRSGRLHLVVRASPAAAEVKSVVQVDLSCVAAA